MVLAQYSDDHRWYRARVNRILGHQLEVELIDFGSVTFVSANDG